MRYASIGGLALLLFLLATRYDRPPEGLAVWGDEARAAGFVVVRADDGEADGYRTVSEPLPHEEEAWLREHGFSYAWFEPDQTGTGRLLRGSYEPAGGGTPVYGQLVFER